MSKTTNPGVQKWFFLPCLQGIHNEMEANHHVQQRISNQFLHFTNDICISLLLEDKYVNNNKLGGVPNKSYQQMLLKETDALSCKFPELAWSYKRNLTEISSHHQVKQNRHWIRIGIRQQISVGIKRSFHIPPRRERKKKCQTKCTLDR